MIFNLSYLTEKELEVLVEKATKNIVFLANMKYICEYIDSFEFLEKVASLFLIGFYQVSVLAMVFLGMPYVVEAIRPENSEILE